MKGEKRKKQNRKWYWVINGAKKGFDDNLGFEIKSNLSGLTFFIMLFYGFIAVGSKTITFNFEVAFIFIIIAIILDVLFYGLDYFDKNINRKKELKKCK